MKDIPETHSGEQAEQHACDYLRKHGLQLIMQNFRCARGEIDLIMRDGDDIVFVEVRMRNHPDYGNAVESVTKNKQRKIIHTAVFFLQTKNWLDKVNCRFDIIAICHNHLEWIKDAFIADIYI